MSKTTEAIKKANQTKQAKKIGATIALLIIVGIVAYIIIAKPTVEKEDTTVTFTQKDKTEENNTESQSNKQQTKENSLDIQEQEAEENLETMQEQNVEDNIDENVEETQESEVVANANEMQEQTIENSPESNSEVVQEVKNKTEETIVENTNTVTNPSAKKTKVTQLNDGTLYSVGNIGKADIVIGDNFYDTQLSEIITNFQLYNGKTIEIEGFYLENTPYTFIGRYSESNLCAYCPQGYSYFEYEWHGDQQFNFTNEQEWLKIKGTLKQGYDDGIDYYYIDVASLEVMNERGQETVKN